MAQTSTKSNSIRQVFCSYCGHGFKRDEHLERHILTHTNIRPFRCRECKVTFKRKDLLRRHYRTIHGSPTEDDAGTARPWADERTPIACANCAQSKTKCDHQVPCGRCVKKNLTCERRTFRRRTIRQSCCKDHPQLIDTASKSRHRGDNVIIEDDIKSGGSRQHPPQETEVSDITSYTLESMDTDLQAFGTLHSATDFDLAEYGPGTQQYDLYQDMDHTFFVGSNDPSTWSTPTLRSTELTSTPVSSDSNWSYDDTRFQRKSSYPGVPQAMPLTIPLGEWVYSQYSPVTTKGPGSGPISTLANLKILENPATWFKCLPLAAPLVASPLGQQPCESSIRDRLLAVTQQIWQMAKERTMALLPLEQQTDELISWMDRVILLPPTDLLNQIFKRHAEQYTRFHLLFPQKSTSLMSLLPVANKLSSGLMVFLTIAQVLRSSTAVEAREISIGLTEVCRAVVQDTELGQGYEFLEVSLTLLQLLQWSGDTTHETDVFRLWGQHAKHVENNYFSQSPVNSSSLDTCRPWIVDIMSEQFPPSHLQHATKSSEISAQAVGTSIVVADHSTTLCSWISLDLELSIFNDVAPRLEVKSPTSPGFPPLQCDRRFASLTTIFESFNCQHSITGVHLRMLVHPLQCLSAHLHQFLSTFDSIQESRNSALGLASKAFTDEVGTLLDRWYRLALSTISISETICPITKGSLVLYHLMVQNNLASFRDVEREALETQYGHAQGLHTHSWMRNPSSESTASLLFHCGQAVFHLRTMAPVNRPLWWAAALYRSGNLLYQTVLFNHTSRLPFSIGLEPSSSFIPLDMDYTAGSTDQNIMLQRFLIRLQGTPVLTRSDGSTMLLGLATDVLDYCLDLLDEHLVFDQTVFAESIRIKFVNLRLRYGDDGF